MQDCEFAAATRALSLLAKNMGMFQIKPGEMALIVDQHAIQVVIEPGAGDRHPAEWSST
jgi:hypothetical protein